MGQRMWANGWARACWAAWALAFTAALPADDVTLDDGRVVSGEVTTDPATGDVAVTVVTGGMKAVQHFPAARVVGIRHAAADDAAIVQARNDLGDGGDAEAYWGLALRAQRIGDPVLARQLAWDAAARDRHHAPAQKFLGMVEQNGIWMKPAEAAIARGEVRFEGRFMTWGAREAVIAARARRQRELDAEHVQRVAAAKAEAEAEDEQNLSLPDDSALGIGAGTAPPFPGQIPPAGPAPIVPVAGLAPGTVYATTAPGVIIAPPASAPAQVVLWPGNPAPPPPHSGLHIQGAGSSGNTSWSFRWNL